MSSLRVKVIGIIIFTSFVLSAVAIGIGIYFNNLEFRRGIISKSDIIYSRLYATSQYVAQQGGLKTISDHYLNKYRSSEELTPDDKEVILKQVPIYAAMKIGEHQAKDNLYEFRVFSNFPRNPKNKANLEESMVIDEFLADRKLDKIIRQNNKHITVYYPIILKEQMGCMTCHGDPKTSPWSNGKDILGYQMENWSDGRIHAVFAVKNDLSVIKQNNIDNGVLSSTNYLAGFISIGFVVSLFISISIIRPLIVKLQRLSKKMTNSERSLKLTSSFLEKNSNSLEKNSQTQNQTLEKSMQKTKALNHSTAQTSEIVESIYQSTISTHEATNRGVNAVGDLKISMNSIQDSNEAITNEIIKSNEELLKIINIIGEIENKTKVINEIVFQTKILSFNASVEASRAGTQGKGFSVVAEEIGNLAKMSGESSGEISQLLNESIKRVEDIITATTKNVEKVINMANSKVTNGLDKASDCEKVLAEIFDNINHVTQLAQDINVRVEDQQKDVWEMNLSLKGLESVISENLQLSQKSSEVADELNSESQNMSKVVEDLVEMIRGQSPKN